MPVPSSSPALGEAKHGLTVLLVVFVALSVVVPVALWLWMAWKCKAGRQWARILSTVLFAIATWATLSSASDSNGAWAALGMIAGWLIGLAVIILPWRRSSSFYFRTAPRY